VSDKIVSKPGNDAYREGWERIWSKTAKRRLVVDAESDALRWRWTDGEWLDAEEKRNA
jgi:hypothetical protein